MPYKAGPLQGIVLSSGSSKQVGAKGTLVIRANRMAPKRRAPYPRWRFAPRLLAGALVAEVARVGAALRPLWPLLHLVLVIVFKGGPAQAAPAPVSEMSGGNRGACWWRQSIPERPTDWEASMPCARHIINLYHRMLVITGPSYVKSYV